MISKPKVRANDWCQLHHDNSPAVGKCVPLPTAEKLSCMNVKLASRDFSRSFCEICFGEAYGRCHRELGHS